MVAGVIGQHPSPMLREATVAALVVAAALAGCGGDDAPSTAGAQACVKTFNASSTGRILASVHAPGANHDPPAHGHVDYPARMAKPAGRECILLVGPDPSVLHQAKTLSGQPTWTPVDASLNPSEAQSLQATARDTGDTLEGTLASYDILTVRTDPNAGRFRAKG